MTRQTSTLEHKGRHSRTANIVWFVLVASIVLSACRAAPTSDSEADEVAIYAAVVRQLYTQDDTFGGNLQPPTLYILNATDDSVGDPEIEQSEPKALPEATQTGISQALSDLPTRIVWISDAEEAPKDASLGAVADGGAIITLGNIHFQQDGSAHVSSSIYIAMLASGGQTYVVEQVDGAWEVTGTTGVLWMS